MNGRLSRRAFVAGLLAAPAAASSAADLVPVWLDGRPARLLLDTGAARSVLTLAAVRRLGLPGDAWVDTLLRGAGGRLESHRNADVAQASAGGLRLFQRPGQALSFSVTTQFLGAADGLLGGDILRHCDIAVSAAGTVALSPAGRLARPARGVALSPLFPDLLCVPVTLDGQALTALLDTGASASLLNARGLHRMGRLAAGPEGHIQALGGATQVQAHRFARLVVGPLTIEGPTLLAAQVPEAAFDLILGLDIIGRGAFTISYARRLLGLPG
jgi:hypothetical protein